MRPWSLASNRTASTIECSPYKQIGCPFFCSGHAGNSRGNKWSCESDLPSPVPPAAGIVNERAPDTLNTVPRDRCWSFAGIAPPPPVHPWTRIGRPPLVRGMRDDPSGRLSRNGAGPPANSGMPPRIAPVFTLVGLDCARGCLCRTSAEGPTIIAISCACTPLVGRWWCR